jgi:hypothetical protein
MKPDTREEQLAKVREIAADFEKFAKLNLKIRTKDGRIASLYPFKPVQQVLVERTIAKLEAGEPVRFIILKARQQGVSTIVEALIYWWTSTHKYQDAKIIAHNTDTSGKLYGMFRLFYDQSHPSFKPTTRYNTRTDITFDDEATPGRGLKSQIDTSTAENSGTGRGSTIQWVHGCLHENSLVVLADGSSKRIADIEFGDQVFTNSGAVAPVSTKTMTGVKQTYELKTWMANESIIASEDHKIMTDSGYKKLGDITKADWIAKPKYQFDEEYNWTFTVPKVERPQGGGTQTETERIFALDEDFGYLVGYYLAEGHISKNLRRVTFTFATGEEFVKRVEDLFIVVPRRIIEGNRSRAEFNDTFMAKALYELCGRVTSKHVPLFGNEWFFKGIYRGYMDGDGSKTDVQRERAPSIHERIARNINRIGDMLGTHGSLHYAERERYGVLSKPVWINSFCHGNDKPHIRKYKFIDGQCFVKVKSVIEFEIAKTYDLEIDHPDHNFETPSGVVSNSEVALWPKGQEIVAGLMQAVPMMANTAVFLESTANGIGDYFHTTWEAAQRGESAFEPLFFPWTMDPEYTRTPPKHFKMTQEEKKVKKLHNLTLGQVYWRRMKMLEFVGDEKRFYQEYPLTDTEAFLASGNPRFDTDKLQEMQNKCYDGQETELIEKKNSMQQITLVPKIMEGAPLKVWFQPQEAHDYVIGADVAEGVEEDYSSATVMDKQTHVTVARFRGDMEPADFGEYLSLLGRWYNNALIGPEINNHGLTTVQRLRDVGYSNIYRRESGVDERYEEYTSKLGWRTDVKTKPLMIDGLSEAISSGQIVDYDKIFIRECMTYIRDNRGRTNAQEGQHDDTVIATAICLQLFEWNPVNEVKFRVKSKLPAHYMNIRKNNAPLLKKRGVLNH